MLCVIFGQNLVPLTKQSDVPYEQGMLDGDEVSVNEVDGVDESGLGSLMKVQHKSIVQLIGYCYEMAHKHTEHNGIFVFSQVIDRVLSFKYMHRGSPVDHIPGTSVLHIYCSICSFYKRKLLPC
jgi:hypothetical protein